jgi:hypothetical protein
MERLPLRPQTMVVSIEMQAPNKIVPSPRDCRSSTQRRGASRTTKRMLPVRTAEPATIGKKPYASRADSE